MPEDSERKAPSVATPGVAATEGAQHAAAIPLRLDEPGKERVHRQGVDSPGVDAAKEWGRDERHRRASESPREERSH